MPFEFFFLDEVYPITIVSIGIGLIFSTFFALFDSGYRDGIFNSEYSIKERLFNLLWAVLWWIGIAIYVSALWFIVGVMFLAIYKFFIWLF